MRQNGQFGFKEEVTDIWAFFSRARGRGFKIFYDTSCQNGLATTGIAF